jgi:hypothetical protein
MILPNNGKVIIIDDQPKDVIELIAALSKEKVPFVHYKEEDLSDLPESPIDNVRLIFLDLELITDTYVDSKNITAPIKTRLIRVIKPNTPYALVIWSKKESTYKDALIADFEGDFRSYKPIFYTSLPKSEIVAKTGAITRIREELGREIAKFKSFNVFLIWEAIVNDSSGKLTNDLTNLFPADADWDKKTKYLLYKLALAYSGKAADGFPPEKQVKNALYTLTLSISETIESSVDKQINKSFNGLISSEGQKIDNFTTVINRLLLLSDINDDVKQPGNLFFPMEELDQKTKKNKESYLNRSDKASLLKEKSTAALEGIKKKYNSENEKISVNIAKIRKTTNSIVNSGLSDVSKQNESLMKEILGSAISAELNITPLCDYAQKKAKLFRILPCALVKSIYRSHTNPSPSYLYLTEADIRIEDDDYFILFDFRFLYSLNQSELEDRIVRYRIKQQLLSDIQVKLGSHVNRSGVLFLT